MGLSRTVSEIDGNFHGKLQDFPTLLYFVPCWRGSRWYWIPVLGGGSEN